jgi:hypothetical protein
MHADTLSWSMTGGADVSGSGMMTATPVGGGEFLITSMTGTITLDTPAGLYTEPLTFVPGGFFEYTNDNLVFPYSANELDEKGLVFDANFPAQPGNLSPYFNLCEDPNCAGQYVTQGVYPPDQYWLLYYGSLLPVSPVTGSPYYTFDPVNFSATVTSVVPEPSVLSLLTLGLLG